ncbi:MAG TPA: HAD-IB family hydrolase [Aggregatilineaceae bacterium]|nr:HAD-IB family hydrolase [Aggregatilineaceae bacterium]
MSDALNCGAALFDIDGTLTTGGDVWGVLLKQISRSRKRRLYAMALPHYALSQVGIVSEAKFRDRWVRLMAGLMKSWSEEQVLSIYEQITNRVLLPALRKDVINILKQHQSQGHPVILVSNMFEGIVQRFATAIGADAGLGSRVAMHNGHCTGRIEGLTCSGERKVIAAREYLSRVYPHISVEQCAGYGDSRSDIGFLSNVGCPVAVYPDTALRLVAQTRSWQIFPA